MNGKALTGIGTISICYEGGKHMAYNVYEYRLREINMMLGAIGTEETEQKEELIRERDKILYELRHTESLPIWKE